MVQRVNIYRYGRINRVYRQTARDELRDTFKFGTVMSIEEAEGYSMTLL
jgi:hypothetical protein